MDFFYRKDTPDFLQPDHRWLWIAVAYAAGTGWTIWKYRWLLLGDWMDGWSWFSCACGFWIDRQRVKKYIPLRKRITECWRSITHNSGSAIPLYHISRIIHTTSTFLCATTILKASIIFAVPYIIWRKKNKKDGLCVYGCSEVPERPAAGRPRKPHFWSLRPEPPLETLRR